MRDSKAEKLLEKYIAGACTPEERVIVESFYGKSIRQNPDYYDQDHLTQASQDSWKGIQNRTSQIPKHRNKRLYAYTSAAAAVLIAIGAGLFLAKTDQVASHTSNKVAVIADVPPGGNYATLTLANGQHINLSRAPKGTVINSFINIQKTNDGEAVFTPSNSSITTNTELNTVATPKGGQFIVRLPDGTKVWLNAASNLKFPSDFKGLKNRKVQLSGEAYFEVAKNLQQPFVVETPSQQVQVLGTHFNINAYDDEPSVKTTLIEGSVKVKSISTQLKSETILKPGQQAILHQDNEITVQQQDPYAVSWKDGFIRFRNADLQTIMRQVSRWYNIEIVYKSQVEPYTYNGGIKRQSNLSELLKMLENGHTRFTIMEGNPRKLIIEN